MVSLEIPPLRERREDIPLLADYFLRRFRGEAGLGEKFLSEDATALLKQWSWPGNVRELENVLKRAMALSSQDVLLPADISAVLSPSGPAALHDDLTFDELVRARIGEFLEKVGAAHRGKLHQDFLSQVEKPLLELVLHKTGGNQVRAAAMLGINRNTLRKRITELGIELKK